MSQIPIYGVHAIVLAFIETKTPKGKLSKEQKQFLSRMRCVGYIAGTARSVEEAFQLIFD